ncbi:hypothetical protein FA13DRAFT_1711565 [Coprinellus micaceus]|uniref:Uncharacterized protein n=1 Tax=Coprinellus micaceus TaxID=71717 RepID=A0A4Y7T437_COPMI|nr:hypothetical protein FA13DRAFT_1711565 [Coprinellus micaceus]
MSKDDDFNNGGGMEWPKMWRGKRGSAMARSAARTRTKCEVAERMTNFKRALLAQRLALCVRALSLVALMTQENRSIVRVPSRLCAHVAERGSPHQNGNTQTGTLPPRLRGGDVTS